MAKILVINPNSNERVTAGLRESVAAIDADIDCCTIENGPFGIESDEDIAAVVPLIVDRVQSVPDYDAYVIACYSDPGLAECRSQVSKPVRGMQESAIETAMTHGGQFGVLALSDESIARHLAYIDSLGFRSRLAAELPLDITVDQSANDPGTLDKVIRTGQRLVAEFGANALILGCAGMAGIRAEAQKKLPVPLIEPAQAAVVLALKDVR